MPARALDATPRRLWSVCFLLAPFAEAVTGFGVGYIIALAALRRLGIGGLPALLLGLYSQSLVPWGALAIGTTVGATLAGLTPNQLGLASALLQMPDPCALPRLSTGASPRAAGLRCRWRRRSTTSLWTALLLALVVLVNRFSDVEIAGAAPTALLLAAALLARRAARRPALRWPPCAPTRPMSRSPWRSAPRGWCRRCAIF